MTFVIPFPAIDPVLVAIGPIVIRWYALAYIAGLLLGWRYMRVLAERGPHGIDAGAIDDFVVWATLGVVLGGRLGYVLFYNPVYFAQNPLAIPAVWQGGMSFHGGILGVILATVWFCRRRGIAFLAFADLVACAAPIGLFLGRVANFINGELYGRPTDVPWAMVFPRGGPLPRHPSQIYEAFLEGLVLFAILWVLARQPSVRARVGTLGGIFLVGYAVARIVGELFREPDAQIGYLLAGTTMGQILSLPMLAFGIYLLMRRARA